MIRKFTSLLFIFLLAFSICSSAQCMMVEMQLNEKVASADVIFEGKVITKQSYWNADHSNIFTANTIEIYKIFKGSIINGTINMITEGGTVDDDMIIVHPSLELNPGDVGTFFATPSQQLSAADQHYEAIASAQGFIKYDLTNQSATDPFHSYQNIQTDVYNAIATLTAQPYKTVSTLVFPLPVVQNVAAITSFSPTPITAGTLNVLIINGSGFGTSTGTVEFRSADDGGSSYMSTLASNILSWSDVQIQVKVPSKAGSGTIRVTPSGGSATTSAGSLTIPYGQLTTTSGNVENRIKVAGTNGSGGITFQYSTTFPTAAKPAFERALSTWRCNTFINYSVSNTTTTVTCATSPNDQVNIVSYDNSCSLGSSILGRTSTYYSNCGGNWALVGLDVVLNSTKSWNYGPGATTSSSQYDLQTIVLHELGHAHLMTHINVTSDPMFWQRGTKTDIRTLSTADINNGNEIMNRSIVANSCYPSGAAVAQKVNPSACTVLVDEAPQGNNMAVFPNPTFGRVTFTFGSEMINNELSLRIYDATGKDFIRANDIRSLSYSIEEDLPSGIYFYSVVKENSIVASGKISVINQ